MIPVCAAIHDLSCYAKSSLTVVLPTLEVLGVEACPLPTALLSSQTDGFESYYFRQTTDDMANILESWRELGLRFDAVYSGFLGSDEQADLVAAFIESQRQRGEALVLVDPVLGDDQSLYGPMDRSHVEAMKALIRQADIITPNTTEAALLLDRPFETVFSVEQITSWAAELFDQSGSKVVITSVPFGQTTAVVAYDGSEQLLLPYEPIHVSYPGCGDLFSSILLGLLLGKEHFQSAVEGAVTYTSLAIGRSVKAGYPMRHGVSPTLILRDLAQRQRITSNLI
ncbi:MAG: pyridoxamine kinase [Sphaerochaeta sp.]|jgi:pyridoxine kinase|nr:pyridoxamine kinase [Sphaerochaeta sp.]MDX9914598.1 pyridoxamine kinase [Sphaerochaeta sp.]